MGGCNLALVFEQLIGGHRGHELVVYQEGGKIVISGEPVLKACGVNTLSLDPKSVVFLAPITFTGEEMPSFFAKYTLAAKKLLELGFTVTVVLDDCETLLATFIKALWELARLLGPGEHYEAATCVALTLKYADIVKRYKGREVSNDEYFSYQEALSKAAHYLSSLTKLVSGAGLNALLENMSRTLAGDLGELFTRVLRYVVGLQIERSSIRLVREYLSECPENFSAAIKGLWSALGKESSKRVYVLVPRQVKWFLRNAIPEEFLVGV